VIKELVHLKVAPAQICVVGEEPCLAYERPALSKGYLNPPGSKVRARIPDFNVSAGNQGPIQDADWYEGSGVVTKVSTRVTAVNFLHKLVKVESIGTIASKADSMLLGFEKLVIATGASAARLPSAPPGQELDGIFYLRTENDFADLVSRLEDPVVSKKRIVVIGGGYLGAEIASALSGWPKIGAIDVVFPDPVLMKHMPFPDASKNLLEKRIVDISGGKIKFHKSQSIKAFKGTFGKLNSVLLENGNALETQICIVAIGAKPNTDIFKGKLQIVNGALVVDENLRTTHQSKDIWAIGDCARVCFDFANVFLFSPNKELTERLGRYGSGVLLY